MGSLRIHSQTSLRAALRCGFHSWLGLSHNENLRPCPNIRGPSWRQCRSDSRQPWCDHEVLPTWSGEAPGQSGTALWLQLFLRTTFRLQLAWSQLFANRGQHFGSRKNRVLCIESVQSVQTVLCSQTFWSRAASRWLRMKTAEDLRGQLTPISCPSPTSRTGAQDTQRTQSTGIRSTAYKMCCPEMVPTMPRAPGATAARGSQVQPRLPLPQGSHWRPALSICLTLPCPWRRVSRPEALEQKDQGREEAEPKLANEEDRWEISPGVSFGACCRAPAWVDSAEDGHLGSLLEPGPRDGPPAAASKPACHLCCRPGPVLGLGSWVTINQWSICPCPVRNDQWRSHVCRATWVLQGNGTGAT